jgi:hypothetical protein
MGTVRTSAPRVRPRSAKRLRLAVRSSASSCRTKGDNGLLLRQLRAAPPAVRARIHPQLYRLEELGWITNDGFGAPIFTNYRSAYPWWVLRRFVRAPLLAVTVTREEAIEACAALCAQVPVLTHTVNDPSEAASLARAGRRARGPAGGGALRTCRCRGMPVPGGGLPAPGKRRPLSTLIAGARQRSGSAPRTRGTPEEARRGAPAIGLSPPHQGDA